MKADTRITRRTFLGTVAAAAAAPQVVSASALGAGDRPAASERIVAGSIGVGGQGDRDMSALLGDKRVQVVAVCDCDSGSVTYERGWRRGIAPAKEKIEKQYAAEKASGTFKGVFTTQDFRELLARRDIDTVTCATPDHWHAAVVVAEAAVADHRRRAGHGGRRQTLRHGVSVRQSAAVQQPVPARVRTGPKRPRRQTAHRSRWVAGRPLESAQGPLAGRHARA